MNAKKFLSMTKQEQREIFEKAISKEAYEEDKKFEESCTRNMLEALKNRRNIY